MSLQLAAQHLASHGRGNDNMLVHMTPSEVNKLQQLAMAHGGSLTINPHTGLVEAGFLENLLKSLVPMALGAFLGPAGAGVGGGLFESALGAAGAVGLGTAAVTGDLGKGLSAGLSAYGGAELGGSLMGMGSTTIGAGAVEAAKAAALEKGLTGEAYNQFIQQSVTDEIGKASLFDKLGAGAKTIANDPTTTGWNFVKQNAIPLMAAAAPIVADEMVETSTDMPKLESSAALTPYTYDPSTQKYKALPSTKLAEGGTTMPIPNTNFDVLKAYDELFGKSKSVETVTPMPNKSQRAYDYLMGRGDYNPAPPSAPIAAAPSSAPTSSQGEGYYEYDPATQSYKWHPKAVETTNDPNTVMPEFSSVGPGSHGLSQEQRDEKNDPNAWGNLTDQQQSAYFVDHPDMAKFVQGGQKLWGSTLLGKVQNYLDPSIQAKYQAIQDRADEARQLKDALEAGAGPIANEFQRPAYETERGDTPALGVTFKTGPQDFSTQYGTESPGPEESAYRTLNKQLAEAAATPVTTTPAAAVTNLPSSDNYSNEGRNSGGGYSGNDGSGATNSRESGGWGSRDAGAEGGFLNNGRFDQRYAHGGIAALAEGGYNLGSYSDGGRLLRGPGDGVSDSIPAFIGRKQPARLADGEFVIPARIVSEIGNGSTDAGARKLYAMMDRIQNARKQTVGKGRVAANSRSEKYLPR